TRVDITRAGGANDQPIVRLVDLQCRDTAPELPVGDRRVRLVDGVVDLGEVVDRPDEVGQGDNVLRVLELREARKRGRLARAPVQVEVFAHDAVGNGAARLQVVADVDRLPEHAQVTSGQRAGAGLQQVLKRHPS